MAPAEHLQYVILLPLRFNDGSQVPVSHFIETYSELTEEFGGVTFDSMEVAGVWVQKGVRYEDRHRCISVTGADTVKHERFMRDYKERLKVRFDQLDIWIEVHRIRLL